MHQIVLEVAQIHANFPIAIEMALCSCVPLERESLSAPLRVFFSSSSPSFLYIYIYIYIYIHIYMRSSFVAKLDGDIVWSPDQICKGALSIAPGGQGFDEAVALCDAIDRGASAYWHGR